MGMKTLNLSLFFKRIIKSYFFRRIIEYIVTIFFAFTLIFLIPRLAPGDPLATLLGNLSAQGYIVGGAEEIIESYKARFGLKGSLFDQYIAFWRNLLLGDLGISIASFPQRVDFLISNRLPWTIGLLFVSIVISWVVGNLMGALLGWGKKTKLNSAIAYAMLFINQIPYYLLGVLLIFVFYHILRIAPPGGGKSYAGITFSLPFILDLLRHAALPSLSLVIVLLGGWMITMRSNVINILGEDYLMLAKAKGLKRRVILRNYVFKNALLPQVTGLALSLGNTLGGMLLVEIVFAYPGIGTLLQFAVINNDYNLLSGILIIVSFATLTASLIIDLIYPLIDPRIRYRGE